ncbi:MAG: hypothetical protein ABW032_12525, partial [Burkholderiaceae bacterium]
KLVEPDPAMPRFIQTVRGHGYMFVPELAGSRAHYRTPAPDGAARCRTGEAGSAAASSMNTPVLQG